MSEFNKNMAKLLKFYKGLEFATEMVSLRI